MIKGIKLLAIGGLLSMAMGSIPEPVQAEATTAAEKLTLENLETLACRELLKMDNDGRDFTIIFYHGLISGAANEWMFDADKLAGATDEIISRCIDSPDEALLDTYRAIRQ